MDVFRDLFFDYTVRTVALGAAALGAVSGTLGAFAVLRRQSLLGDAISHAALPGIVLAFLLTGTKTTLVLVLGAAIAGWIATLFVQWVVRSSRIPQDSVLGIVLSVFFGIGLVLLTYVQKMPDASQAGLSTFLFGQAATLVVQDVLVIAGLGGLAVGVVALGWKQFKLLAFDREFGISLGLPMRAVEVVLTTVLVVAIVIGLQTVGVVLMSAMVVAPAVAARQWTDSLGHMVLLSALIGALSGVAGAVASATTRGVPTGPAIVLAVTVFVIASLLLAPRRGLVAAAVRHRRSQLRVLSGAVLSDLLALARQHPGTRHGHAVGVLETMRPGTGVRRTLGVLAEQGLATEHGDGTWMLTELGEREAGRHTPVGEDDDE